MDGGELRLMFEQRTDLWTTTGIRAITTNGVVFFNGEGKPELVMGAGIAKQAKTRYPKLPELLGEWVRAEGNVPLYIPGYEIVTFPTKENWKHKSPIALIVASARLLAAKIETGEITDTVYLPRPGCLNGGLDWSREVRPAIEDILPDSVVVINWP